MESESYDSELTRRGGIVERDSKVGGPFSNGGGSVGSALSGQRSIMPTQAGRRERQDGMFMHKAALAHLMAAIRQDVTHVTCLADAVRR
ncbi:unnamed protein product [Boreogadus saida]